MSETSARHGRALGWDSTKGETAMKKGSYVIVRTYSAGCFAGVLDSRKGQEVRLKNARRLWYWSGAASLSQLAVDGTSRPSECKFPAAVPLVVLTEAIELLAASKKAQASIAGVPEWRA